MNKRCPKCGEIAYKNTNIVLEGADPLSSHCYCMVCNYENERETWADLQPITLSPELEKIKEFKDTLVKIHSDVTNLHGEMVRVFHCSTPKVKKDG